MPKEKLVRLFREIANYIVSLSLPHVRYIRLTSSRSKSERQQRALSSLPKRWLIFMQLMLWKVMIKWTGKVDICWCADPLCEGVC